LVRIPARADIDHVSLKITLMVAYGKPKSEMQGFCREFVVTVGIVGQVKTVENDCVHAIAAFPLRTHRFDRLLLRELDRGTIG
jgi:hypothetical protein